MPQYFLPQHVYICLTDDGAVFLDVRRDQYVGIGTSGALALRALMNADARTAEELADFARELVGHGLFTLDQLAGKRVTPIAVERTDAVLVDMDSESLSGDRPRIKGVHALNLFWAYATAKAALRLCSLEYAVNRVRRLKTRDSLKSESIPDSIELLRELVRSFLYLRPLLYAAHHHCLFDSLVLMEFLSRYRLFPTMLMGVRTAPFAAHSWVQYGRYVLNDKPTRTNSYVPILAA